MANEMMTLSAEHNQKLAPVVLAPNGGYHFPFFIAVSMEDRLKWEKSTKRAISAGQVKRQGKERLQMGESFISSIALINGLIERYYFHFAHNIWQK